MQRLLILSCTERKRHDLDLLPAVERYDGPAFRLLRGFRKQTSESLEVYILPAQFGLIDCEEPIPYYDQMMTPHRATEPEPQIGERFRHIFRTAHHGEQAKSQLLFCMGRVYFDVLKAVMVSYADFHQWSR
jgi:hypothetical protein